MADTKISALTTLTAAQVDPAADVAPVVDTSATTTKKITVSALGQAIIVLGTEQASTSGTSIDFTGIPSGTKRIVINLIGVSLSGTDDLLIQLGDAGGFETSGYIGSSSIVSTGGASSLNFSSGFRWAMGGATAVITGAITLNLEDASDFTWTASGVLGRSDTAAMSLLGGSKATSQELSQVRITSFLGANTFAAGVINISYS